MGNYYNSDPNRPRRRKKVSKETLRKRQLAALCVIALIVLLLVIVLAKACSKDSSKGGNTTPTETTTTTSDTTTTTMLQSTTTTTTTTSMAAGSNDPNGFKLDKYSVYVNVGEQGIAYVQQYPDGSTEADEVWKSSDPSIATVDTWGHITGVSGGECYVTLTSKKDPTQEATIKVVVTGASNTSNTDKPDSADPDSGNDTDTNKSNQEPQQLAEAPAPSKIQGDGFHYEGDVLIVNKTYSMPASYNPGGLDATCYEWFNKLAQAAAKEGLSMNIASGFRSYDYQATIYNNYCSAYGSSTADTFSARPGNSEHQTGLAIDVNDPSDNFASTPEAPWLAEHCWEYGFIIRYPQGKQDITGYKYEPWHIRYVGYDMAKKIHDSGNITLEEYFGLSSQYPS